jgi:hypothetical protein
MLVAGTAALDACVAGRAPFSLRAQGPPTCLFLSCVSRFHSTAAALPSRLRLWLALRPVILLASVLFIALLLSGCPPTRTVGRVQLRTAISTQLVETASGTTDSVALCEPTELPLGGGYAVFPGPNAPPSSRAKASLPAIVGSYPYINHHVANAKVSGWVVEVLNEDPRSHGYNWDSLVLAFAYCATAPNARAIVPDPQTTTIQPDPPLALYPEYTEVMTAFCPSGFTVTSGGFLTTPHATWRNSPLMNAFVTRSTPCCDSNNPTGWKVQQWPLNYPDPFTTQVYVLCVQGLGGARIVSADALVLNSGGGIFQSGDFTVTTPACASDEISTGGGFWKPNDQFPPEYNPREDYPEQRPFGAYNLAFQVGVSESANQFYAWSITGYGERNLYQAGLHPATFVRVRGICLKVPEALRTPSIRIVLPQAGSLFTVQPGADRTGSVEFVADAKDAAGQPLPNEDITWSVDGGPTFGTGARVDHWLAGSCATPPEPPQPHVVRATATDSAGLQANDMVNVFTGCALGDHAPAIGIVSPAAGSNFPVPVGTTQTDLVIFTADARELPSGNPITGANVVWMDSRDGVLGTGATLAAALSGVASCVTPHTVTVTATDSAGKSASDRVTIGAGGASGGQVCPP